MTVAKGKACGASHIPKNEKCSKAVVASSKPSKPGKTKAVVAGVAAAGVAGAAAAYLIRKKPWTPTAEKLWKEAVQFEQQQKPPPGAEYLSKGAHGTVWITKDRKSIVKLPRSKGAMQEMAREVAIQNKMYEAGVRTPKVSHFNPKNGAVMMEFLDGATTVQSMLSTASQREKTKLAREFVEEIAKVHKAGVAHNDIHLENVMSYKGTLHIIDWGQAKPVTKEGLRDINNLIYSLTYLDSKIESILEKEVEPLRQKIWSNVATTQQDFDDFHTRVARRMKRYRTDTASARMRKTDSLTSVPSSTASHRTDMCCSRCKAGKSCAKREKGKGYRLMRGKNKERGRLRRSDELSVTDYVLAAEGGFDNRSDAYIRTRLDIQAQRTDTRQGAAGLTVAGNVALNRSLARGGRAAKIRDRFKRK